jgi:hypothetical protein
MSREYRPNTWTNKGSLSAPIVFYPVKQAIFQLSTFDEVVLDPHHGIAGLIVGDMERIVDDKVGTGSFGDEVVHIREGVGLSIRRYGQGILGDANRSVNRASDRPNARDIDRLEMSLVDHPIFTVEYFEVKDMQLAGQEYNLTGAAEGAVIVDRHFIWNDVILDILSGCLGRAGTGSHHHQHQDHDKAQGQTF